jgi:hypothetical protein
MHARCRFIKLLLVTFLVLLAPLAMAQQNAPDATTTTGKLRVEADWPAEPKGLTVYLDPGADIKKPQGKLLGQTPLKIVEVPAGKHTVTVWLASRILHATTVDIPPGGEARISYPVQDSLTQQFPLWQPLEAERVHGWCEAGDAEECVNAGHLWLHGEVVPNVAKAMIAYHKGCDMDHPYACLALGYLRKRHGLSESENELLFSCRTMPETCWYHVLPSVSGLTDPTKFAGRWSRKDPVNYIDVGAWVRVGASPSVPTYTGVIAEVDIAALSLQQKYRFGPLIQLGLTHQTARIEELGGRGSYRLHSLDITFGIGYSIRLSESLPLYARMGVIFDFSIARNTDKYSGVTLGGWGALAYRLGQHRFEAGCMLGAVPERDVASTDPKAPDPYVDLAAAAVPFLRYTLVRSW